MKDGPHYASIRSRHRCTWSILLAVCLVCGLGALLPASASALISTGDGDWVWQNPLPQGGTYLSGWFLDANRGWLVSGGDIFHTSNGGVTLTVQARHNVGFTDITFVDARHGWAVGRPANINTGTAIIYRTTNGRTWTRVRSKVSGGLWAVSFANTKVGWAVGGDGADVVLHTTDGGLHWSKQPLRRGTMGLFDVQAVDARRAWICGDLNMLLRTTDGGATWQRFRTTGSDGMLLHVQFTTATTGWVSTDSDLIRTTDGGRHWTHQLAGSLTFSFADSRSGWATGFSDGGGVVHRTTDGGKTWTSAAIPTRLRWVQALGSSRAVIGGYEGFVAHTTDGATWQSSTRVAGDFFGDLNALQFVDATTGWAAGSSGEVLKTADGGASWTPQASGTDQDLHDVGFIDAYDGWAVGRQGVILHTSDGGATWTPQTSGVSDDLAGVSFVDAQHGWVVGGTTSEFHEFATGVILVTSDGGQHWVQQTTPIPAARLHDVAFADALHGWAVGEIMGDSSTNATVILATVDGGATWAKQLVYYPPADGNSSDAQLRAIACIDAQHVVAVGYDDLTTGIFRTADGGASWQKFAQAGTFPRLQLSDVVFADASRGWAVSSGAYSLAPAIIRTTDGGRTWTAQAAGPVEGLNAVSFVSATHGWVAGDAANILTTTTGGSAP